MAYVFFGGELNQPWWDIMALNVTLELVKVS
jgi:hypothetical protein